jgi:hypothetical protein
MGANDMSVDSKRFLKFAWILASVACFVIPTVIIPFDNARGWLGRVGPDMVFGMLVLSFPVGALLLLAVAYLVDIFMPIELPISMYVLLWFCFFVTGYFQWFHLLPRLLDKFSGSTSRSLTTLGLEKNGAVRCRHERKHRRRSSRRAIVAPQVDETQVLQFHEIRRTPLERVIGNS